jgi:hypothetical protein
MNISTKRQTKLVVAAMLAAQTCAMLPMASFAGPVRVAGQQAFNVSTGGGGMTADARTTTIQKNLDNALVATPNPSPSSVGITYVKGQPVITLGGFYVTTVDTGSAKALKTTPTLLAQKWSNGLKAGMKDSASLKSYIAQISGSSTTAQAGTTQTNTGSYPYYQQGRVVYVPAGLTLPVQLNTAVTSSSAHPGDRIEAKIASDIQLGDTAIPAGSTVSGTVTESASGSRLGKSGTLGLKFNSLRTPSGQEVPISAHIVGGIGKYQELAAGTDIVKGETTGSKVKQAAIRGAIGAGGGALLGTAIGAIAGSGRGAGRGAIAGTAIGAGLGVAESLLLRKGADVKVSSGDTLNLQLDAPASLAVTGNQL